MLKNSLLYIMTVSGFGFIMQAAVGISADIAKEKPPAEFTLRPQFLLANARIWIWTEQDKLKKHKPAKKIVLFYSPALN